MITRIIKITDEMEKCDIFMPAGDKNTIVEVKADTPPVAVDYLDELFLRESGRSAGRGRGTGRYGNGGGRRKPGDQAAG